MHGVRRFLITMWQPALLIGVGGSLLALLFGYKLGSLPSHVSAAELNTLHTSGNWHNILNNPLYAPYTLMLWGLQFIGLKSLLALRCVSVGWALLSVLLFFSTLRHWFTKRIAIIGTLLFATSTWFLIDARVISPQIMQAGLVALLAIGGWLRYSRARVMPLLIGIGLTAVLCYIPGMIWFILLGAFWQRRALRTTLEETPLAITLLGAFLSMVVLAPLIYGLVRTPQLVETLLGLPNHFANWRQLVHNALDVPLALFVRAPLDPSHWLGRLPLLDVFTTTMFVLGLYSFFYRRQLDRAKVLVGIGLLVTVLVALGGGITLTMLLPAVYIVVTAGANLMLQRWQTVFPRNPLARGLGMGVLVAAVLAASFYQVDRYYQAWQHAPATKQVYSQTL